MYLKSSSKAGPRLTTLLLQDCLSNCGSKSKGDTRGGLDHVGRVFGRAAKLAVRFVRRKDCRLFGTEIDSTSIGRRTLVGPGRVRSQGAEAVLLRRVPCPGVRHVHEAKFNVRERTAVADALDGVHETGVASGIVCGNEARG